MLYTGWGLSLPAVIFPTKKQAPLLKIKVPARIQRDLTMDRRLFAVCATATLLILAFLDSTFAGTKNKPGTGKRALVIKSRVSASTRSSIPKHDARTAQKCIPCATELARNTKGHSVARSTKKAKSLPCHPKNYIDPKIAVNYNAALRDIKRAGIKPQVTSAWRSSENQEQLYR